MNNFTVANDLVETENEKNYGEYPECLLKIVEYLNSYKINVSRGHNDGRVCSIEDEGRCVDALRQCDEFIVKNFDEFCESECDDNSIYIIVPKERYLYDIKVVYNKNEYYINIKSSTLKTRDNVGCVDSIMFGLFGKTTGTTDKPEMYDILFAEYDKRLRSDDFSDIEDIDYYFLVIDKNNCNCFITSLCHMNESSIRPNGSNLPFQCNWGKNSIERKSKKEVCELIMKTIAISIKKSMAIGEKKNVKSYLERLNL